MNVTDFNFELPPELIAQDPLEDRSGSRLLVLKKKPGEMEHRIFKDKKDRRDGTPPFPRYFTIPEKG